MMPPPSPRSAVIDVTPDDDRYMRLPDLARYSTLSVRTLQKMIADPVHPLPAYHIGERITVVRKRDFDTWLDERRAGCKPAADTLSAIERIAREVRGFPVDK
jgi:hypothetical protein